MIFDFQTLDLLDTWYFCLHLPGSTECAVRIQVCLLFEFLGHKEQVLLMSEAVGHSG